MEKVVNTLDNGCSKILACINMALTDKCGVERGHEMAVVWKDFEDEDELYCRLKSEHESVVPSVEDAVKVVVDETDDEMLATCPNRREIEDIRDLVMQWGQEEDFRMNHGFRPGNLYRFHVTAFLRGDEESYLAGEWTARCQQLMCRTCARWSDDADEAVGVPLAFIDYTIQLKADARGVVVIPHYARPAHFLTETADFVAMKDELTRTICRLPLARFLGMDDVCWEFHCSRCYVNLFTKNVINITAYVK